MLGDGLKVRYKKEIQTNLMTTVPKSGHPPQRFEREELG
jgi:hypothetical protein